MIMIMIIIVDKILKNCYNISARMTIFLRQMSNCKEGKTVSRREAIRKAEEFCQKHQINEYPVGIISLCRKLDIQVFEEYLEPDVSGFIIIKPDGIYPKYNTGRLIVANASDSAQRRRFTVAHELGHYILHRKNEEELYAHRDAGANGGMESEANIFASVILMPEELVKDSLKNLGKNVPFSIKAACVSRDFAVSMDAARIRLNELGIS